MKDYIKPECMPFYYDENGVRHIKKVTQIIAYTADGYLLPCCWCDTEHVRNDLDNLNMYSEHSKLSNNDSVESILFSHEWKNFTHIISNDYEKSPVCCKQRCGVKYNG